METQKSTNPTLKLKPEDRRRLERMRDEFRRWYGCLPVSELASNRRLIEVIEAIERLLNPLPVGIKY